MKEMTQAKESKQRPRVLLIDQEPGVLRLLKVLLTRSGYHAKTAQGAKEAFQLLSYQFFDCILTDAVLDVETGYDFIKRLKQDPLYKHIPIIVLSRKRQQEDIEKAMRLGVRDYLVKPIQEELLIQKVKQHTGGDNALHREFSVNLKKNPHFSGISFEAQIISFAEYGVTLRLPFPIQKEPQFKLSSNFFQNPPLTEIRLRWKMCIEQEFQPTVYDITFEFSDMPEKMLIQYHQWLQKRARKLPIEELALLGI
jgi:CheY-like chemotaxis protein